MIYEANMNNTQKCPQCGERKKYRTEEEQENLIKRLHSPFFRLSYTFFSVVHVCLGYNCKVSELADGVYNGENDDGPKASGRIVLVEPG